MQTSAKLENMTLTNFFFLKQNIVSVINTGFKNSSIIGRIGKSGALVRILKDVDRVSMIIDVSIDDFLADLLLFYPCSTLVVIFTPYRCELPN